MIPPAQKWHFCHPCAPERSPRYRRLLDILGLADIPEACFDIVHSNAALEPEP